MDLRKIETKLSWFTLAVLAIYAPVETWTSLPAGLLNPFYLVDLISIVLLFSGALKSLRARPNVSPALLCAAYGWSGANAWRATFDRINELDRGTQLSYGTSELWTVGIGMALSLLCFALSLYLVLKASNSTVTSEPNKAIHPTRKSRRR